MSGRRAEIRTQTVSEQLKDVFGMETYSRTPTFSSGQSFCPAVYLCFPRPLSLRSGSPAPRDFNCSFQSWFGPVSPSVCLSLSTRSAPARPGSLIVRSSPCSGQSFCLSVSVSPPVCSCSTRDFNCPFQSRFGPILLSVYLCLPGLLLLDQGL